MLPQHTRQIGLAAYGLLLFGILLIALLGFSGSAQAGGVLYAAPSASGSADCSAWTHACSLQTALTNAAPGDQIWVQMGVHKPAAAADRSASFALQPGVELYGGFAGDEDELGERDWQANLTVLSGDIDNNDLADPTGVVTVSTHIVGDNSYHVVTASGGITESARLDGFVITAGLANGASPDNIGGGMKNDHSSPTVTNVIFSGSQAGEGGGMHNFQSSPALVDVVFSGHRDCSFGCGMANAESSPALNRVIFRDNRASHGGAMGNGNLSSPVLTNVVFSGNTSGEHGGAMNNSTNSSPTLVNVTFSGNSAGRYGGAIFNYSCTLLTLTNVVMWGNPDLSSYEISSIYSTVIASYSDINYPGGYPGTGNLNANPLFADADGPDNLTGTADDDLRLLPGSPAIDAANNSAVPAGVATDIGGEPRFVDDPSTPDTGVGTPPVVDMGAYEADLPKLTLEKEVTPATAEPGEAITFTLTLASSGSSSAAQVVLTDTLPAAISVTSVISSGLAIVDSGHTPAYVWNVQDMAPGASGVITITGELSAPLAAGDYTNEAVVAYALYAGTASNSASAVYGVPNVAPAFTSAPLGEATEDALYTCEVATQDRNGDALTITAPTLPGWLTLSDHGDGTATLSGTPASADVGDNPVELEVKDGDGLTGLQSFTIAVARKPMYYYLPVVLYTTP